MTIPGARPNRRHLLQAMAGAVVSCFAFSAARASKPARLGPKPDNRRLAFFLGVASADPQPEAIMLWSRVEPLAHEAGAARVVVQLSLSSAFEGVVLERDVIARPAYDYTMRVFVDGLKPSTTYYYRFIASDGAVSRTGRTWTAPAASTDAPLAVALASCQQYPPSKFGAYRHLINEEKRTGRRPDFVLHVGDYVYDDVFVPLPVDPATGLSGPPPKDYETRVQAEIARLRAGGADNPTIAAAAADFDDQMARRRRVYHAYHRDMDLQDARALFPFVCTWDDGEFGNNAWQSFDGQPNEIGRVAATQTWFEFVPQILSQSRSIAGVENHARDYERPRDVKNAPLADYDADFLANNPDNLKAIQAMTSYRSIGWGSNADIIVTDTRSYRGPGTDPSQSYEELLGNQDHRPTIGRFELYDGELIYTLAMGRNANGGNPPETVSINGVDIPNPRRSAPETSMLGRRQKAWFKQSISRSTARWKVLAVATPMCAFRFDPGEVKPGAGSGYNWIDCWDGYPNEREELLDHIRTNRIGNVVALAGDRHAHYAGLVADRLEKDTPRNVLAEFHGASISSFPRADNLYRTMSRQGIGELCRANVGGETVTTLDMMMTKGSRAVADAIASGRAPDDDARYSDIANPHLHYADNGARGYVFVEFGAGEAKATFVTTPNVSWDPAALPDGPAPRRIVGFSLPEWRGGEEPALRRRQYEGERIFDTI